jgi:hypothetical protein
MKMYKLITANKTFSDEEARLLGRRRPSEAITENGPVQNGVRRKEPYASVENQSFIRVCI